MCAFALSSLSSPLNRHSTQYQSTNPFLPQSDVYRYGFNGKEKLSLSDPNDGQIDFGARVGHSLLGRMWSLDAKDQFDSDYVHSGNSPISGVDPDGNYFFRLFGSTSAQRQSARLYQKVFGGKIENLMKESINVAKQMRGEDFNYGGDWFLQSDGTYMFEYGTSTGVTVALQVTYFDYNSGTPISYHQNPSKENNPPGLEIHGETIKLGATELMNLNLEGSSDGDLSGRMTSTDVRVAGHVVEKAGTLVKYTGYIGALLTEGATLPVATAGGRMEEIGTGMQVTADLMDGNNSSAVISAVGLVAGKKIGDGIDMLNGVTTSEKMILNAQSDAIIKGAETATQEIAK
jgi:hypothetical protein